MRWLFVATLALAGIWVACSDPYGPSAALSPAIQVCQQSLAGPCVEDMDASAGGQVTVNGRVETIALPIGTSSIHQGDPLVVLVSLTDSGPGAAGITWPGTITASGAISLVNLDGDGGPESVEFALPSNQVQVLATANLPGVATISASVAGGPPTIKTLQVGTAAIGVAQVVFVEHVGLAARESLTLCSSRAVGTFHILSASDSGAVEPAGAAVQPTVGGCPEGYAGQVTFGWTGFDPSPLLVLVDDSSDASTTQLVPMLGTGASVQTLLGHSMWLCELPPPPADDAGASTDAGDAGDAGDATTTDGAAAQAQPFDAEAGAGCAGHWLIEVQLNLRRNGFDVGTTEPLAGATLSFQPPAGGVVAPTTVVTDQQGNVNFELDLPASTLDSTSPASPIVVVIDGQITESLLIVEQEGGVQVQSADE